MKKFLLLLILIILPLISSASIDMKANFSQGETLIAEISGIFLQKLTEDNLFFYRDNVKIPIEKELTEFNNKYYLYVQLPENEDNYSISIKNIKYKVGNSIKEDPISKEFRITNKTVLFSLTPGFVKLEDDWEIKIQNFQDRTINIKLDTNFSEEEEEGGFFEGLFSNDKGEDSIEEIFELMPGENKIIDFVLENITQEEVRYIELSSENQTYRIPIFVEPSEMRVESNEECDSECDEPEKNIENESKIEDEPKNETNTSSNKIKNCSESGGIKCEDGYECEGTIITAEDSLCCIGVCIEKSTGSFGKTIAWILIFIIVGIITWFLKTKYGGIRRKEIDF